MSGGPQGWHSPDSLSWWTGTQWVAAWSADSSHWFDGSQWVPRKRRPPISLLDRSDRSLGIVWGCLAVSAAALLVQAAARNDEPSTVPAWTRWTLGALGASLVVMMPVAGYVTGRSPRRLLRILVAMGIIWGSLIATYVLSMAASTDPGNDDAAGAGVVLLGIPTAFAVAALVGLGALVRLAMDRVSSRRSSRR